MSGWVPPHQRSLKGLTMGDEVEVTYRGRVVGNDEQGNLLVRAHSNDLFYMTRTVRESDSVTLVKGSKKK
jgi:hypothetical protein